MLRWFCGLIAALSLLALVASYGGALHPAGDSLAVFRPVLAGVLILAGLGLRRVVWQIGAALLGVAAVAPLIWVALPVAAPQGGVVIYQKNLRFDLADPSDLIWDMQQTGADIVLLQEVSQRTLSIPQRLHNSHPHQVICPAHRVGAVAILSRFPFAGPPDCHRNTGLATARIETPVGQVSTAVLHLHWPWPSIQSQQRLKLLPALRDLPQPVIVAGDFNMVPWSHSVASIEAATGTTRVGPVRPSFVLQGVYPMPIDQVLAPTGWQAQVQMRDLLGSDHRGMLARIAPPDSAATGGS